MYAAVNTDCFAYDYNGQQVYLQGHCGEGSQFSNVYWVKVNYLLFFSVDGSSMLSVFFDDKCNMGLPNSAFPLIPTGCGKGVEQDSSMIDGLDIFGPMEFKWQMGLCKGN